MRCARALRRLHAVVSGQFGLDPLRCLSAVVAVPRFVRELIVFKSRYRGRLLLWPCLHDRNGEAGVVRSEYFWQDLYVAQKVHEANPHKHVDVGSRLDGFVAHVASFRDIELLDIRPLLRDIPGVRFRQVDIVDLPEDLHDYCDSISCLHALEHVGLGRYGDAVDPDSWQRALENLARMLKRGGRLYLSVPCGQERVEFNAHRVFHPRTILRVAGTRRLRLQTAAVIHANGPPTEVPVEALEEIGGEYYVLVVFLFVKDIQESLSASLDGHNFQS